MRAGMDTVQRQLSNIALDGERFVFLQASADRGRFGF